jgi:protein-L-isoaspartate(D-aspartate) O-methyltransferase
MTTVSSTLSPRDAMIESQLRVSRVTDERVIAAIRSTAREPYVPASRATLAYADAEIEIIPGRHMVQPMILGRLLAAASVSPADQVLVVGAATGYAAAVIARLAGSVVALESDMGLAGIARANVQGLAHVEVVCGPLNEGHAAGAPYDVIFIDGGVEQVPDALAQQLADQGLLVGIRLEQGVGRGFTARKSGGALGFMPFMDASARLLPGFAMSRGFSF